MEKDNIIINTLIPFLFVYAKSKGSPELHSRLLSFLAELQAENNSIVRKFHALGVTAESGVETQALLQLKKVYCDAKKCLNCTIASQWLKA